MIILNDLPSPRIGLGQILISKWNSDLDSAEFKILDSVEHLKIFEFYSTVCQKLNETKKSFKDFFKKTLLLHTYKSVLNFDLNYCTKIKFMII